jgi:hypothetical protein
VPLGTDAGRPPAELLAFDVRDWLDDAGDDDHGLWVARAHQRHAAACAAWTAATGLPVHRPAPGETWPRYWERMGPPPPRSAAVMRARLLRRR